MTSCSSNESKQVADDVVVQEELMEEDPEEVEEEVGEEVEEEVEEEFEEEEGEEVEEEVEEEFEEEVEEEVEESEKVVGGVEDVNDGEAKEVEEEHDEREREKELLEEEEEEKNGGKEIGEGEGEEKQEEQSKKVEVEEVLVEAAEIMDVEMEIEEIGPNGIEDNKVEERAHGELLGLSGKKASEVNYVYPGSFTVDKSTSKYAGTSSTSPGKNVSTDACGDHLSHAAFGSFSRAKITVPLSSVGSDLFSKGKIELISGEDGCAEMQVSTLKSKKRSHLLEDLQKTRVDLPLKKPRSVSPAESVDSGSNIPSMICNFFAKGWCIKGSSCRFLHPKDGVVSSGQETRAYSLGPSNNEELSVSSGSRLETESLKSSVPYNGVVSTDVGSPTNRLFQRTLVRSYGGTSQDFKQFSDNYDIQKSTVSRRDFPDNAFGISNSTPSMSEHHKLVVGEEFEDKRRLQNEMTREQYMKETTFCGSSSLAESSVIPERMYYPAGFSYDGSTPFVFENGVGFAAMKKGNDISVSGANYLVGLNHSRYPSLRDSLETAWLPSFSGRHSGMQNYGPKFSDLGHCDAEKSSELDSSFDGYTSISLGRHSSSYFSATGSENIPGHSVSGDQSASTLLRIQFKGGNWEPSKPFKSSFVSLPFKVSSPRSQYDPLVDSIEVPNVVNGKSQSSNNTIPAIIAHQQINGDAVLYGEGSTCNAPQVAANSFSQTNDKISGKDTSEEASSGTGAILGPRVVGGSKNASEEERASTSVAGGVFVSEMENVKTRSQVNVDDHSKQSRMIRLLRVALVETIKDLLKPSWQRGHLTREAHKAVVKKAVEKVISSLQPDQLPNSTESVNELLSLSRPKIVKLVQGYVEKYARVAVPSV